MEVKYPHVVEGHAVNALAVVTTQPSYYPSPAQINDPSFGTNQTESEAVVYVRLQQSSWWTSITKPFG